MSLTMIVPLLVVSISRKFLVVIMTGLLLLAFTEEEIKEEVWNCDGDKSPGPDYKRVLGFIAGRYSHFFFS